MTFVSMFVCTGCFLSSELIPPCQLGQNMTTNFFLDILTQTLITADFFLSIEPESAFLISISWLTFQLF